MPYGNGDLTLGEQLDERAVQTFHTKDILKDAREDREEIKRLRETLRSVASTLYSFRNDFDNLTSYRVDLLRDEILSKLDAIGSKNGTTDTQRNELIEQCAVAAEQQDRAGYEWVMESLWAKILKRAGDEVRKLKSALGEVSAMNLSDLELLALRQCAPQLTVVDAKSNKPMFEACARLEMRHGFLKHIRTDKFEGRQDEIYEITPEGAAALRSVSAFVEATR